MYSNDDILAKFDSLAEQYDERHWGPQFADEDAEIIAFVRDAAGTDPHKLRVLDVGAGTGLTLDLGLASTDNYLALDPSRKMLDVLMRKYPPAQTFEGPVTRLAELWDGEPFDLVLGIFSALYLSPRDLAILFAGTTITHPGTRYVMMTAVEGHCSTLWSEPPACWARAARAIEAMGLPRVGTVGKFDVWAGTLP